MKTTLNLIATAAGIGYCAAAYYHPGPVEALAYLVIVNLIVGGMGDNARRTGSPTLSGLSGWGIAGFFIPVCIGFVLLAASGSWYSLVFGILLIVGGAGMMSAAGDAKTADA